MSEKFSCKKYLKEKEKRKNILYSIIIPVYNEEKNIDAKIKNTLEVLRGREAQILIVSDGSTDKTNTILRKWEKDPQIKVEYFPVRGGKAASLNYAFSKVEGDWIFLTDGNVFLNYNFFEVVERKIMEGEAECFFGNLIYLPFHYSSVSRGENLYWNWDKILSYLEKKAGLSSVGVVGSALLVKKEYLPEFSSDTILDDLEIISSVIEKGGKVSYLPQAIVFEYHVLNSRDSIIRKERIISGALQWISKVVKRRRLSAEAWWLFFSHKIVRWFLPLLFLFNLLASRKKRFWMSFFSLPAIEYIFRIIKGEEGIKIKFFYLPFYLLMLVVATVIGTLKFLTGSATVLWTPTQRR